jgi:hypothetical protein
MSRNRLRGMLTKELNNQIQKYDVKTNKLASTKIKKPPRIDRQEDSETEYSGYAEESNEQRIADDISKTKLMREKIAKKRDELLKTKDNEVKKEQEEKKRTVKEDERKEEMRRKEKDMRRKQEEEEDMRKQEEEIRRKQEEEMRRKQEEEEMRKQEEEMRRKQEEEMRRKQEEEEMRKQEEEEMRKQEEMKRQEEEEEEIRIQEEEMMRKKEKEMMRKKEKEMMRKKENEEMIRKQEGELLRRGEKKENEEMRKKEEEMMRKQEEELLRREEKKQEEESESSDSSSETDGEEDKKKESDDDSGVSNNPFDNFPRTSFLKLIKQSGAESIATPVVDTIRDVCLDFMNYMFDMLTEFKKNIESSDVKHFIELFIEDFNELPQSVILSQNIFERCILEICNQRKIKIKRDAVSITQEFLELVISKIIKGAILIADNSRRRRITEREIEIAYEIYMC